MLMPSGMCLCHFACAGESTIQSNLPRSPSALASVVVGTSVPKIPACKHCSTRQAAPSFEQKSLLVSVPSSLPHSPVDPDSTPPGNHQPDCPVLVGVSPRLAVLTDSTSTGWAKQVAIQEAYILPKVNVESALADSELLPTETIALFISHCSLLI